MPKAIATGAAFAWYDATRQLAFTWNGHHGDPVYVHDPENVEITHTEFTLPEAVTNALGMFVGLADALALFQVACAAWRPDPDLERRLTGYSPADENEAFQRLKTAVERAQRAGNGANANEMLRDVYVEASHLVDVRG